MVYKAIEERKECEKLYKKGIKAFPNSGVLYSEYGEMLWSKQNYDAIKQWEKGIEVDPNYSSNYYHAAKHYYLTTDKVWGIIYGEIFVNLESYSKRTAEIKNLLLEGYKKMYTPTTTSKQALPKTDFVKAFETTLQKQESLAGAGISTSTLTMIRTRFILDWYNSSNGNSYPFRLFEYHRQLLKEGNFDAYNQWLFGTAENLLAYQQWTTNHADQYQQFNQFQKNRVFKMPSGQYYQSKL
jgi:tetratricopeptide (TPR) repeat protein